MLLDTLLNRISIVLFLTNFFLDGFQEVLHLIDILNRVVFVDIALRHLILAIFE